MTKKYRALRDHTQQIFIIGSLFLIVILAIAILSIYEEANKSNQGIFSSTLNIINRSQTDVETSITTNEQSIIMQNGEIISSKSGETIKMKNGLIEIIRR